MIFGDNQLNRSFIFYRSLLIGGRKIKSGFNKFYKHFDFVNLI